MVLTLSHIQQNYSTQLRKHLSKNMENLYKWKYNYWKMLKRLWQKEKLLVLSNCSFCHNFFKSRLLQMPQNASIGWKGIKRYQSPPNKLTLGAYVPSIFSSLFHISSCRNVIICHILVTSVWIVSDMKLSDLSMYVTAIIIFAIGMICRMVPDSSSDTDTPVKVVNVRKMISLVSITHRNGS